MNSNPEKIENETSFDDVGKKYKFSIDEAVRHFEKVFSQFENDKSESDGQERRLVMTGLFYWLLSFKLQELIDTKNWYVGILLAYSFLEDMGKRYLGLIFKDKINSSKIDRLTLEEVTMLLLASGAINCKIYQRIMEVKESRNRLAHDPFIAMSLFMQTGHSNSKESQHARSIINKAAFCLREISFRKVPAIAEGIAHLK